MARNKKYSHCPSAPPADSRTMRYMRQGRAKSRKKNSRRSQFLFFSRQNFLCVFPPYSIQLTPYYKRLPYTTHCFSRLQPFHVARKKNRLTHIPKSEHLLHDALRSHPPSAVRRHAVLEDRKIAGKVLGRKTVFFYTDDKIVVNVNPLPARRDFHAAIEKIETLRYHRIIRRGHHIHGTNGNRIVRQENRVAVVFLFHILADEFFPLRINVTIVRFFAVVFFEDIHRFRKFHARKMFRQSERLSVLFQDEWTLLRNSRGDGFQDFFQLDHHVFESVNEPHLRIQRYIFVNVPCRKVRLGAKHRTDLKYALKSADTRLFVELRTLRKICRSVKIVYFEKICAAFRRRSENLRGLDLPKSVHAARCGIGAQHTVIHRKNIVDLFVA